MVQNVFDDFEPPTTTDGSYTGRRYMKQKTKEHLDQKLNEEIQSANSALKSNKTKVSIKRVSGSLQLIATLPIKPGDKDTRGIGRKQYHISLNIPANLDGLQTAKEEAYELGKLIARKTFVWNEKYLGVKALSAKIHKTNELLSKFENQYFKTHKRTIKSEHTFSYYYKDIELHLGKDFLFTPSNIKEKIDSLNSESTKLRVLKACKALIAAFRLDIELEDISVEYTKPIHTRNVPGDEIIVSSFQKWEQYANSRPLTFPKKYLDTWMAWRWVYGMLAVFGLRPREVINKPDFDWWLSSENSDNTFKVHDDNKTGYREVFPLYNEWIEEFNLKDVHSINEFKKIIADKSSFSQLNTVRVCCSSWFRKIGLDFKPYDLRHAWAIRAHILGVPIKAAADNLGHTMEVHTETYQRWFSLDMRKMAINQALSKRSEIEEIKEENFRLKMENERLKIENARLKLISKVI